MPKRSQKQTLLKKALPPRYSKAYFIANGNATNAARAKKLWRDIVKLIGKEHAQIIDVSKFSIEETEAAIKDIIKKADSRTLLCVGGGDGTVSTTIRTIVSADNLTDEAQKIAVLPLWGGNANDMAVMLNGMPATVNIKRIVLLGRRIPVYPLSVVVSNSAGKREHIAACYASFGATAEVLSLMEESSHKRGQDGPNGHVKRVLLEFRDVMRSASSLKPFKIQSTRGPSDTDKMFDRIFINGSRYAKVLRTPIALNDVAYFELSSKKGGVQFVFTLFRFLFRAGPGHVSRAIRVFTLQSQTYMQIDGEVYKLERGTKVEVKIHDTPVWVLTRKLSKDKSTQ